MTALTDIVSRLRKVAAGERRYFALYVYHREARGFASRALRKVLPKRLYEYRSKSALVYDGVPREDATPKYTGEATDEEMAKIEAILEAEGAYGVEIYHD